MFSSTRDVHAAKRTSPSSVSGLGACAASSPRPPRLLGDLRERRRSRGSRSRLWPPRRCTFWAQEQAGSVSGTSWKIPSRPSCSVLSSSQRFLTARAESTSASPNTCGCRRIELLANRARHCCKVALPALLEEQREEEDLEQEIAQLVEQLLVVGRHRRVGHLVGLLDRVRDDRPSGLLAVPGAVAPQPLGELLEVDECPSQPVRVGHASRSRCRPRCRSGPVHIRSVRYVVRVLRFARPSSSSPCSASPAGASLIASLTSSSG